MKDLSAMVESLSTKVDKLLVLHRTSHEEITTLRTQNQELEQQLTEQQKTIEEINERNKVLTLAKSVASDGADSLEIKLKINELVREIDKCIALLNK